MAKLTKNEFSELNKNATRYRWEFLRRNSIYGRELVALKEKGKRKNAPLSKNSSTTEISDHCLF